MADLFLSDAEIDSLCAPLKQPRAQVRYLRDVLKLNVSTKPNGRALVVRVHAERVLSGEAPASPPAGTGAAAPSAPAGQPQANVDGFLKVVGGSRGKKKSVEPA